MIISDLSHFHKVGQANDLQGGVRVESIASTEENGNITQAIII